MKFKRLTLYIIFICTISILLITPAFSATYYVKNGGNDSADGLSDGNAWATIAKINDYAESPGFSNGDIIQLKRGSTWSNDEPIGWDGALINWGTIKGLTIQDYGSGALPRLDANTQQAIVITSKTISNLVIKNIDVSGMDWRSQGNWSQDYNIRIHSVNGLTIDGVYCDGHVGASNYNKHGGCIGITNVDGDIEVKNCTLKNMYKDTFANTVSDWGQYDSAGIGFWYEVSGKPKLSGTVNIHDNSISNVYSDCIAPEGIQTTTNIYNNTLSGWGENAVDSKGGRYHNIYNNDISWNNFGVSAGATYWGGNIWGCKKSSYWPNYSVGNHTFHDNYIHDSASIGIRLSTTLPVSVYNNHFKDVGNAVAIGENNNNMSIYNNLIVMTVDAATPLGHALKSAAFRSAITLRHGANASIYNNSIYISSSNHNYGIYIDSNPGAGSKITNNIIQMTRNSPSVYPLYSAGNAATVSSNAWCSPYSNRRVYRAGTVYIGTEQAAWRNAGHTNGIFSNPGFTDPANGDFILRASSPCILIDRTLGVLGLPLWNPSTKEILPPQDLSIKIKQ